MKKNLPSNLKTSDASRGEQSQLPEETIYEKPEKVRKVQDKTGWEVRPENEMIMGGSKKSKKG